jgi:2',3'-cyclic-nucleotide 2'-phosphodiesterase (5'-nucleotidase family)
MENNTEQKIQEQAKEAWLNNPQNPKDPASYIFGYIDASQQTEQLQAEIERLKERHEKDITALLHLGMVKDEQIERLKNIIKRWKT